IMTILAVLVSLLTPWPLKILVDNVLGDQALPPLLAVPLGALAADRFALLVFAVLSGLAIALLENGVALLNEYVRTKISQSMALDVRGDLLHHSQPQSLAFPDENRIGMLIYAINTQADAAPGLVMAALPLAQSVLTLGGMFWISFQIDARLALLSLAIAPFL